MGLTVGLIVGLTVGPVVGQAVGKLPQYPGGHEDVGLPWSGPFWD